MYMLYIRLTNRFVTLLWSTSQNGRSGPAANGTAPSTGGVSIERRPRPLCLLRWCVHRPEDLPPYMTCGVVSKSEKLNQLGSCSSYFEGAPPNSSDVTIGIPPIT